MCLKLFKRKDKEVDKHSEDVIIKSSASMYNLPECLVRKLREVFTDCTNPYNYRKVSWDDMCMGAKITLECQHLTGVAISPKEPLYDEIMEFFIEKGISIHYYPNAGMKVVKTSYQ